MKKPPPTSEAAAILAQRIEANLFAARSGMPGNVYEAVNAFNLNQARRKANKAYYDKASHASSGVGTGRGCRTQDTA